MEFTSAQVSGWFSAMLWPMLRIGGMLTVAPIFGANVVPARVKIVLALALTAMVAPLAPAPSIDPLSAAGLLAAMQQVLIGVAIGFAVQLAFDALVVAGQTIAMTMGLGFATLVDPNRGATTPVLSQFMLIIGLLMFLALDGHIMLIAVLVESFRWAPIGTMALGPEQGWMMVGWGAMMFEAGLAIALPAVISLLTINLGMGVVSRAAPQLNLFAVGFPVAMLFGFLVLLLSLPALQDRFTQLLEQAFVMASRVTGGPG